MKFSQRLGLKNFKKPIQIDSIDNELRNGLWSTVRLGFIDLLIHPRQISRDSEFDYFCNSLWLYFYKQPIDLIPIYQEEALLQIRNSFFELKWYEVFDFLEFIAEHKPTMNYDPKKFQEFINNILETENSGYRFIEAKIAPITNPIEIAEIEEAINSSGHYTALEGANIHLKNSLTKISDKKFPDYRNSIKESVSAIESVVKMISDNQKDAFGGAIDKLKSKIDIHPALVQGFKNIYGYTSNTDGIRHGLTEETNCDFEDAKFMLVSCSAFINYIIVKTNKSGITLNK